MALVEIGKVAALTGQASATSVEGTQRTLSVDAPVYQDDTVTTAKGSSVELSFVDGTIFSQGSDSVMLLDEYVYNQEDGTGELLFNLARGSLRAVSGEIAKVNPQGFNVETPLSTVGIRGTTFFVLLNAAGQVVGVEAMDPTHIVEITTDVGTAVITTHGDLVAVQLDGFISDPTQFTPDFLNSVREQIPLHDDPHDPGDAPDDSGDDPADEGGQDIPDELEEDLTDALQQLQVAGGAGDDVLDAVHDAMGGEEGGLGSGTDSVEELQELLSSLQAALSTVNNAITNVADDILSGNTVEDTTSTLDLKTLDVNTTGEAYSSQLESMGYTFSTVGSSTSTGDSGNNAMLGSTDAVTYNGNDGNDIIFGGDDEDALYGGDGVDYLYGGNNNDELYGGGGADYLVGGSGADKFKFAALTEIGDTIRDFSHTDGDQILIKMSGFGTNNFMSFVVSGFSAIQNTSAISNHINSSLVYDPVTGNVYHHQDGDPNNDFDLVCTLEGSPDDVTTGDLTTYLV